MNGTSSRLLPRFFASTTTKARAPLTGTQSRRVIIRPQETAPLNIPPKLVDGNLMVFSDTKGTHVPVPYEWLRDHCHCEACVHPSTKQRLIETFDDISPLISPETVKEEPQSFLVKWNDGHESRYSKSWLSASGEKIRPRTSELQGMVEMKLWTGKQIKNAAPTVDYDNVMTTDKGLKAWLYTIRKYGFCYIENTPITPEATEKLLERIAYIRHTHYGGFYDFTADLAKGDTAYTQLGIGAHTDNTYFSDPAGLQVFHLLSHPDGEGGASQLVDGFAAARQLLKEDPKAYQILSQTQIDAHASGNEDSSIQPWTTFPTLVHDPFGGQLVQVRWNTTDRAAIDLPIEEMQDWYNAARKWTGILKRFEYWEQLQPGKPLIFDNWRVLHGRSAFTGKRRMCGGYINRDDFISRFKMTNWGRERVLELVARG
ncbi:hypothetical protein FKW77_007330 [Venturia effusa]|uniref:Trimethyllysine dioxygenase n=1 Tax=Venturia effusa TaxID=50376 RepID=A0A517LB47_9PEZI|nr:hypothetical protein FKW77_007330 [Venturia effusa]